MGRILGYAVLLGNLSLILALQHQRETHSPAKYEHEKQHQNHTYFGVGKFIEENEKRLTGHANSTTTFSRRLGEEPKWPPSQGGSKTRSSHMTKSLGLSSYMSDEPAISRRRFVGAGHSRSGFYGPPRHHRGPPRKGFIPPFSQKLLPAKNYNKGFEGRVNSPKDQNTRLASVGNEGKSFGQQTAQGSSNYNSYQKFNYDAPRNPRFFHHQRQNSKFCDPCNSVPWVPLLEVPNAYRKERNQHFGGASGGGSSSFGGYGGGGSSYNSYDYSSSSSNSHDYHSSSSTNHDHHAVSSNTHDFVLPSSPLVPPTPSIIDGTISSSFGLPAGNIPTAHGLLAPLNHFLSPPTPDYSAATTFLSPPSLLDGSPIPELSPVPIVPIYDSGQFYSGQLLDSSDIGLVPPTVNSLAVSNVVFTISEGPSHNSHDSHQTSHDSGKEHEGANDNINFKQNAAASSQSATHSVVETFNNVQTHSNHLQQPNNQQTQQNNPEEYASHQVAHQTQQHQQLHVPHKTQQQAIQHFSQQNQQHHQELASQQTIHHNTLQQQQQPQNYNGIEIVKSVPLVEFSTGTNNNVHTNNNNNINTNVINQNSNIISNNANSDLNNVVHQTDGHVQSHVNYQNVDSAIQGHGDQKTLDDDASNYLVPPPPLPNITSIPHLTTDFGDPKHSESQASFQTFNSIPSHSESQFQGSLQSFDSVPKPLTSPSASWLFLNTPSSQGVDLKPPQPIIPEAQPIASIVNSEFQPIPAQTLPISSGVEGQKTKKVQIIIPYTTKAKTDLDTNSFESVRHEVFQTLQSLSNKSEQEFAAKFEGPKFNQLEANRTFGNNQTGTVTNHKQRTEVDRTKNPKYVTEMQHILAKNIKELLYREIEKAEGNQNYRLQNNIDNWTALEYSNHQTMPPKEPKELISQALSVTSIPGTSISHALLPSKKIPDEYFASTASPFFEETFGTLFKVPNASVYSRPFTARPSTTPNRTDTLVKLSSPSPFANRQNDTKAFENNYTVVSKSRVNYWGKLNDNAIIPEPVGSARGHFETTASLQPTSTPAFLKTSKIEIVTPVSVTTRKVEPTRRTTRHVRVTERTIFKRNSTGPFPKLKLPPPSIKYLNATKGINATKPIKLANATMSDVKKLHIRGSVLKRVKNIADIVRSGSGNRTAVSTNSSVATSGRNEPSVAEDKVTVTVVTSPPKTNQSEEVSINDIIPFRNKELPWESEAGGVATTPTVATTDDTTPTPTQRQRKSLIKQVKSRRPRRGVSEDLIHSLRPHSTRRNSELGT